MRDDGIAVKWKVLVLWFLSPPKLSEDGIKANAFFFARLRQSDMPSWILIENSFDG